MSTRSGPSDGEARARAFILIPARNEEAAIGRIVRGCRRAGFNVVVVDDASRDGTAVEARTAGAAVLAVPGPQHGKTAALRHALSRVPAGVEWIFLMDGDGQHQPADLDRFWERRAGRDLVVGDRFPDARRIPLVRRLTNRAMSALLCRSGIADSQCGFRLVRRAWLGSWLPGGNHFQFETELALQAARTSARVENLPIAAIYESEQSKISVWRDSLNFARLLAFSNSVAPSQEINFASQRAPIWSERILVPSESGTMPQADSERDEG